MESTIMDGQRSKATTNRTLMCLGPVLTQSQLERIRHHCYKSRGTSLIEPICQIMWNHQVDFVPNYIHPNILTICGFLFILSGLIVLISHSPDLKHEIPSWCFIYNALCIFFYQILDAIDGKHARKIKLCSPIGEIFDHGFDALTAVALTMEFSVMIFLGNTVPLVFASLLISLTSFYVAQWHYYSIGYINFMKLDVTEYLASFIVMNIATAIFGQKSWEVITINNWPLNHVFISVVVIFSVSNLFSQIIHLLIYRGHGPNGTTVAETSILTPLVSIILISIMYISIFIKSKMKQEIYKAFVIYHFLFGVTIAKITLRLIVSTITKSEFHVVDTEYIIPALLFFNQYFGYIIPETVTVIYLGLIINVCNFFFYMIDLTISISRYYNYPILFVPQLKHAKD